MSESPDRSDQIAEVNLSVDPDILSAPGAGDLAPEFSDPVATEADMRYTHGGTPCS